MLISEISRDYFKGFEDLSTFSTNDCTKNSLGLLKVASYFTIVLPLLFSILYGASELASRAHVIENLSAIQERISNTATTTLPPILTSQTIEQQIQTFCTSSTETRRIFTINEMRVGIIFNPNNCQEPIEAGPFSIQDPLALISETPIPQDILDIIDRAIPEEMLYSQVIMGSLNGQPVFSAFQFE